MYHEPETRKSLGALVILVGVALFFMFLFAFVGGMHGLG
jgi:hypothetical protein